MAASDLLGANPEGSRAQRSSPRGLLLVVVNPIPGQVERNRVHFLEEGLLFDVTICRHCRSR